MPAAFVTGLAGPVLTARERAFLKDADPFGVILFRRNVEDPDQLRRLTGDVADALGRRAPVVVDQEGGRVQRLTAPNWRKYPSARRLRAAAAGDRSLIRDTARLMAADLTAVGITVDCMPNLDLGWPGQSDVVGDRAYAADPETVAACGRAAAEGMLAGGVLPVIKHMPGHGRAMVDSHHALPMVDAPLANLVETDFRPFVALADLPAGMTAHIVFTAIDPDRPATQSAIVIGEIIRGRLGFDGLLFSDDLSMNALSGTLAERAARAVSAGCDIALHCNGVIEEMEAVAAAVPRLAGRSAERAEQALSRVGEPDTVDLKDIVARLDAALEALDRQPAS